MADVQDVLIVGGGAAGYTAGIFAARDRCRALLLEKFSSGGQVLNCEHITNFPGFPQGVAGYTLGPLLQEQATAAGLQIAMNEVTAVHRDGDLFRVETDGGAHTTRTLIVASGSRFTTLGVPGEEEFLGELRAGALQSVKADLALRALVEAEAIEITDDELDEELAAMGARLDMEADLVRSQLERAGRLSAVRSDRRKAKAMRWLVDSVELVDENGKPVSRDDLLVNQGEEDSE